VPARFADFGEEPICNRLSGGDRLVESERRRG